MKSPLLCSSVLVVVCVVLLPTVPVMSDDLSGRVGQLESQTRTLQAELEWLRAHPVRLPATTTTTAMSTTLAEPEMVDEAFFTWEELQAEMKKHAWSKGSFRIVPYGFLWGNMVYQTERTHPGSYTLFVRSAEDEGEDEFVIDGRSTRVGVNVSGPRLWLFNYANSGGKVEIDFQGSPNGTVNQGGVLLRHAYWEVKNEHYRLLFGQTWDVISPLDPGTIMYSVHWLAGNMGYHRAQLRFERYVAFSDTFLLTLQMSLNDGVVSDFTTDADVAGQSPAWPIVEGRLGFTLGPRDGYYDPITMGVSGHVGENLYDFDNAPAADDVVRRTWSVNLDMRIPVTDHLGIQGEFFTGENLATYQGGIGQGIDKDSRRAIGATGGWIDLWYDWTADLHTHVGWTIDDPFDHDLTTAGLRTYNQSVFVNLIYDVTAKFTTGVEISSWKTLYNTKQAGDAFRVEFMGKYAF